MLHVLKLFSLLKTSTRTFHRQPIAQQKIMLQVETRIMETICNLIYPKDGGGVLDKFMAPHEHFSMLRDMAEIGSYCKKRSVERRIVRSILSAHVDRRTMDWLLYDRSTVNEIARRKSIDGRKKCLKRRREEIRNQNANK